MPRTLATALQNELATNNVQPVHLITISFGTPVNITDAAFDLTSSISGSSVTYSASDFIMGISNFTEETDITKQTLDLTLSGADQAFISTCLNENVVNDAVTIFRAFLEKDKESNVVLKIVSHWADFEKTSGRKTNNTSQQRFFSTDVGMDYSSETVLDIKWGRT